MSDLIRRVRQVLADAELLSEGSTQSWDKSSPSAEPDHSPRGTGSLSDSLCGSLTAWVDRAEERVQEQRKRDTWPSQYTREEYRVHILTTYPATDFPSERVSELENGAISGKTVRKWRREAA